VTAVVTGIGIMAPTGAGTEQYWSATIDGRCALGRLTAFDPGPYPATVAGQITAIDPAEHLPSRLIPATDRMTRLSLLAAEWALADAEVALDDLDDEKVGVVTAATAGGFEFGQRELQKLWRDGPKHVSAYQSYAWFYAVNSGQISIRHGMRGPSGVLVTDESGGLDVLAQARRLVRGGGASLIMSGGVDSNLCPWGWVAQMSSGRLSTATDPTRAYRPFHADAGGHVPGEGGAHLVVESADAA
jgi:minimal PKS chain-length factor (CLF/KS beta)